MLEKTPRDIRLVDCSPAPNVQGSDVVGGSSEAAFNAEETFPLPVCFGGEATAWACATCVSWVYKSNWNSRVFSLVLGEPPKLIEAPRVLDATLGLSNRYPRAYAPQVFEGYASLGAFALRNSLLETVWLMLLASELLFRCVS